MKNLITALVKSQSEFKPILKKTSGVHKAKYAELEDLINGTKEILNSNGLAINQTMKSYEDGKISIMTKLMHTSGEMDTSEMIFNPSLDPQKVGSHITYFRRYGYQSIIGISTEKDDDADSLIPNNKSNIGIDEIIKLRLREKKELPNNYLPSPAQLKLLKSMADKLTIEEKTALNLQVLQKTDCISLIEKYMAKK